MTKDILKLTGAVATLVSLFFVLSPSSPAARTWLNAGARGPAFFATLTVNSTADDPDLDPGDGLCLTAGGVCTLRAAIELANADPGSDAINFLIPSPDPNCNLVSGVCTISPASPLPAVSQPAIIDGYTQPLAAANTLAVGDDAQIKIELDGAGAGVGADGLRFTAGSSALRGLAVYGFAGDGVELSGAGSSTISGNFIGHTSQGAVVTGVGNGGDGVRVSGVGSNTIGGAAPAARNLIAQNAGDGVDISGAAASANVVAGNYVGTDRSGAADFGNLQNGVLLAGPSNTVGGSTATPGQGAGNVISGNALAGVRVTAGGNQNTVAGNLIGTQSNGTTALRNDLEGVFITNTASHNTVGGATADLRNVISGNNANANTDGVEINGAGTSSNTVAGNYIGTDISGTLDLGNAGDGVRIAANASSNNVGGPTPTPGAAPGNVISGNTSDGIQIGTVTALTAPSNNTVQGNLIGTNAAGTAPLRNDSNGVFISGSPGNLVGGSTPAARNVITGGTAATADGVDIQEEASDGNTVAGNYIGTDINGAGTNGGASDFGSGGDGVRISTNPDNNNVGGPAATPGAAPGNVIAGNGGDGVEITGGATSGNAVQGNLVGTQADGTTAYANAANGVHLNGAALTSVGGTAPGASNTISFNLGDGVFIPAGINHSVRRNSIHSNAGLGIDLGTDGLTPNDPDDPDAGGNNLQNFPVINSAAAGSTNIAGTLNSTPSTTFTVEFFSSPTADPSAHGEGQTFLDSVSVTTDANGDASFTHTAAAAVPAGQFITATATDPAGNTSEFSNARQVLAPTAARLRAFTAAAHAGGVRLEWQTAFELDNLGFQIYRAEGGRLAPVNPSLVAGSALRSNAALTAGQSYAWLDRDGGPDSRYYLEDVDTNGVRTMHGPFWPAAGGKLRPPPKPTSPLLAQLGARANKSAPTQRQVWEALSHEGAAGDDAITRAPSATHGGQGSAPRVAFGTTRTNGAAGKLNATENVKVAEKMNAPEEVFATETVGTVRRASAASASPSARKTGGASRASAALGRQRELAAAPAVKLFVRRAGWHRVTRAALEDVGLSHSADPARLQLYADGEEVALRLDEPAWQAGAGAVEFYGTGLDTPSTDTRVYWLVEGVGPGRRIRPGKLTAPAGGGWQSNVVVNGPVVGADFPRSFTYTLELKERLVYFAALLNGEGENFFGRVVGPAGLAQALDVRHVDREVEVPAQLRLALQGVTNVAHEVLVELNGLPLGAVSFAGRERAAVEFQLSPSQLREGANELRLRGAGGASDVSLTDYARLNYTRLLRADADRLWFPGHGGAHVRVEGFTTPDVRVVDVTDPAHVEELNVAVEPAGDSRGGGFVATVTPRAGTFGARTLLAFTGARVEEAAEARPNAPSNLVSTTNAADYLVVTRADLRAALAPLVARRAAEGLAVAVVDVEDVFDEFSFGAHTPHALRDFLAAARSARAKAPRYLLLAGDGSYDPRDYLGQGSFDLVPARLVDTASMEAVSDEWFADFDGDGLSEMAVGRLPVRTPAEAALVAGKIAGHTPDGARRSVLLVSDRRGADGFDFEAASGELAALVPEGFGVVRVNRGAQEAGAVRSQIVEAVGEGQLVVNYLGHGSLDAWTGEGLLRNEDAAALSNADQLPLFVLMTCLNGHFADPALDGLGEALVKAGRGGALAAWGSSGMTEPDAQARMNLELYRLLFGGRLTLGDAVRQARTAAGDPDVRRTWVLLGDPATHIR
jgi:CSLREA domain-containing protein